MNTWFVQTQIVSHANLAVMPKRVIKASRTSKGKRPSLDVLASNLKILRSVRGLTQDQLAELSDMERTQISAIERSTRSILFSTLDRLADALNVEPWELLRPRDDLGR